MLYEVRSVEPVFGKNYDAGWSFGTYKDESFISSGIAWFTRWDEQGPLPVSHVGIVVSENHVIESHRTTGVAEAPLEKYFNDPHTHIYFRKPRDLDQKTVSRLSAALVSQLGAKYDMGLIKAHLLAGTFLGHWLDELVHGRLEQWLCQVSETEGAFICSELTAWAMQQTKYDGVGCLEFPACTISPAQYIWDSEIFTPYQIDLPKGA